MKLRVGDRVRDKRDGEVGKVIDLWTLPDGQKMATLWNSCHQYVRARKPLKKVKCPA